MPGRCYAALTFGLVIGRLGARIANGQETILAHQGKPLLLNGAPLRFTRDSEITAQALRSFGNGKPILFNGKPNSDHGKAVKLDGPSIHWNGRLGWAAGKRDFDQRRFYMELIFDESDIRQAAKTLVEVELPLIR